MTEISFSNVVIVAAVAFAAPLALGLIRELRLSAVVLEIVLGIAVGPSGLGWVKSDLPVQVLALVGLAFLLFLAGLDVELGRLRGRLLRLAGLGFLLSLGLALSVGYALDAAGPVRSPLFVGIVLSATALGLVAPILKDAGESEGEFGQLVLAAATIADFGTVILLSLLFSRNAGDVGSRLALLGSFVALVAAAGFWPSPCGTIEDALGCPGQARRHHGTDPCPGGGAASDRVRWSGRAVRIADDPWGVHGRSHPEDRGPRRHRDPPPLPAEAGWDRLRVSHPRLLRLKRR